MPKTNSLKKLCDLANLENILIEIYNKTPKKKRLHQDYKQISLDNFYTNRHKHLKIISEEILLNKYKFSSLEPFFIPKSNGKERIICTPSTVDKFVQKAVYLHLLSEGNTFFSGINYGF